MSKRVLGIILVLSILIYMCTEQNRVLAENNCCNTADLYINSQSKISDELKAIIANVKEDELITVYVWIDDIDYDVIVAQTEKSTGLSEELLLQSGKEIFVTKDEKGVPVIKEEFKSENELSEFLIATQEEREKLSEDVDTYINEKRKISREAYAENNGTFIKDNLNSDNVIFQSQYAPMIICRLTKSEIGCLSENKRVSSLSLYEDCEAEDCGNLDISLPAINADTTIGQGIMGSNVKIGQIETRRPKTGVSSLYGKSITRRGTATTDHASLVAAIMIGSSGVAPSASIYSTSAKYNVSTNSDNSTYSTAVEYENIEWLVSQGVDVINRSFGGSTSSYDAFSKWIDHIVNQHNVTFVQAAGNGGNQSYVDLQSFNAIVVGGINDMGTLSKTDDSYYIPTSCVHGDSFKPEVVAPAVGFSIPEAYDGEAVNGTSFAAPHVTGVVAQMMCTVPSLKLRPDAIKAALMASCDRKTIPGASMNRLTTQEGAGVVNALNAVNSLSRVAVQQTYYTTTGNSITFNFYPLTTGRKAVVISWLKRVTGTGTNHSTLTNPNLTNFDLHVYDSSGNEVSHVQSSVDSVEYIGFNATTTNKYTVVITRVTNNTTSERITLANYR